MTADQKTNAAILQLAAVHCDKGLYHGAGRITRCIDAELIAFGLAVHRMMLDSAPIALMDDRDALGVCALTEDGFPPIYALQGKRVRLVLDEVSA